MTDVTSEHINAENGASPDPDSAAIYIDGHGYTFDDLTFEEQGNFREWLKRDIAPPTKCRPCRGEGIIRLDNAVELCPRCSGEGEIDEARESDYVIAMITIIKRRTSPEFTIDEARRFTPSELKAPRVPPT